MGSSLISSEARMKKIIVIAVLFLGSMISHYALASKAEKTPAFRSWAETEEVISQAFLIRAIKIEESTDFRFKRGWKPKVSIEWNLGGRGMKAFAAEYRPKTESFHLPISMVYELNVKYNTPLRLLDPKTLSEDVGFGRIADHELGHALADQISRKLGKGPYFTPEQFYALSRERQLGLNIVSEGIGIFFENIYLPPKDALSDESLPATKEDERWYTFEGIAFDGGHWLVRDILTQHGMRGMAWLVSHPFTAKDGMRAEAHAYQTRALKELTSK